MAHTCDYPGCGKTFEGGYGKQQWLRQHQCPCDVELCKKQPDPNPKPIPHDAVMFEKHAKQAECVLCAPAR